MLKNSASNQSENRSTTASTTNTNTEKWRQQRMKTTGKDQEMKQRK